MINFHQRCFKMKKKQNREKKNSEYTHRDSVYRRCVVQRYMKVAPMKEVLSTDKIKEIVEKKKRK